MDWSVGARLVATAALAGSVLVACPARQVADAGPDASLTSSDASQGGRRPGTPPAAGQRAPTVLDAEVPVSSATEAGAIALEAGLDGSSANDAFVSDAAAGTTPSTKLTCYGSRLDASMAAVDVLSDALAGHAAVVGDQLVWPGADPSTSNGFAILRGPLTAPTPPSVVSPIGTDAIAWAMLADATQAVTMLAPKMSSTSVPTVVRRVGLTGPAVDLGQTDPGAQLLGGLAWDKDYVYWASPNVYMGIIGMPAGSEVTLWRSPLIPGTTIPVVRIAVNYANTLTGPLLLDGFLYFGNPTAGQQLVRVRTDGTTVAPETVAELPKGGVEQLTTDGTSIYIRSGYQAQDTGAPSLIIYRWQPNGTPQSVLEVMGLSEDFALDAGRFFYTVRDEGGYTMLYSVASDGSDTPVMLARINQSITFLAARDDGVYAIASCSDMMPGPNFGYTFASKTYLLRFHPM